MPMCPTCGCDRVERYCAQCGRAVQAPQPAAYAFAASRRPAAPSRGGPRALFVIMLVMGVIALFAYMPLSHTVLTPPPAPRPIESSIPSLSPYFQPDTETTIRLASAKVNAGRLDTTIVRLEGQIQQFGLFRDEAFRARQRYEAAIRQSEYEGRPAWADGRYMSISELQAASRRVEDWLRQYDQAVIAAKMQLEKLNILRGQVQKCELEVQRVERESAIASASGAPSDRLRCAEKLADLAKEFQRLLDQARPLEDLPQLKQFSPRG